MIPHAKDAYAFPLQQKRDPFEKENVYFAYTSDDPDDSTTSCESENPSDSEALRNFSKTSVMFVSISFIILMVVSCCWLAWYYLQRFRYAHAKDRMQRRLFTAAKKALTKIPTRPIKAGDKELELECPVCIDQFQPGDILRILLCHHIFHKACVDPWLLEQRVCCVCRQDILKATGYNISSGGKRRHIGPFGSLSQSHDDRDLGDTLSTVSNPINLEHNDDVNIPDSDHSSTEIHSTISEHGRYAYRFNGEIQDPFTYGTPAPQLVQVINPGNTKKFNIIPLTVHAMPDSRKGKNKCDITGTIEYNDPSKRPCSEPISGNKRSSSSNYEDNGVIKEIGRQSFSSINSGGRKQSLSNNSNSVNPRVQVVNLVSICNSKVNENVKSKEMEDTINGSIMEAPKPGLTISSSRPTALFRNMTKSVNHETDMSSGEGMPGFIQEPQRSQIFHDDLNTAKVVAVHQPSKN
uniref:RING-type domain-containing protein n=1 Tax=Rhabditophanes sp. KR3021 TaxID=114890 RepID=A0AC35U3R2_9BILA